MWEGGKQCLRGSGRGGAIQLDTLAVLPCRLRLSFPQPVVHRSGRPCSILGFTQGEEMLMSILSVPI